MNRTSWRSRYGLVPSALALALLLGACSGGGGSGPAQIPSVLDQLGVPTNLPPRTDAQTLQPLQKRTTVFDKRSELYLSGATTVNSAYYTFPAGYLGKRQILLDGADAGYAPLFTDTTYEGWTAYDAASAAADVDGDGRDEVVVLYRRTDLTPAKAYLRVVDRGASGYEQSSEYEIPGDASFQRRLGPFAHLELAAGDVDGDRRDEVAAAIGGRLVVLDRAAGSFSVLAERVFRPGVQGQITSVAVGNVDTDPDVEIVVVNGIYDPAVHANYFIFAYGPDGLRVKAGGDVNPSPILEVSPAVPDPRYYGYARVTVGDLDADNLNEIVFAGDVFNNQLSVTVMGWNPGTRTFERTTTGRFPAWWDNQWMPVVAVIDADGLEAGRQKELLVYRYVLHLDADGKLVHKWNNPALGVPYWDKVTVGDFTADGREEVAFVSNDQWLLVYGFADGSFRELKRIDVTPDGHHTTLCAANVDDDSTVVRYTGEYELLYGNPQVLAVLASPPYYAGQDASAASTSFTLEVNTEDESGETFGFYAGLSIGSSAETPFWGSAGSSKFAFTVEAALDANFTAGTSRSYAITRSCPPGQNLVFFASTPFDVYYYEVVSSPDPAQVGQRMSIQIPRDAEVKLFELGLYNSIVSEEHRVPADVLKHRFGDPWSYPTRADMQALFVDGDTELTDPFKGTYLNVVPIPVEGGFRTPDPFMINVGRSDGWTTTEMSSGASRGFGTNFDLQVGIEFENVAGGVLVGGKAGFHYGYSHSYTTTNATAVSGTIPDVPLSMPDKPLYSAGLMTYPYPTTGNARFVVVNYWVEP